MVVNLARCLQVLLGVVFLTGCAQIPKWSDQPQQCADDLPYVWNQFKSRKYICVDMPEVVTLPAYVELLNVPPAEKKPVVAVYKFMDLTGQRKARDGIADFSTAVTQGGTEMLIDALKTAGQREHGSVWLKDRV